MKSLLRKQLIFAGLLLPQMGGVYAEPVDPRFPAEWHAQQDEAIEPWFLRPGTRVRQLEAKRQDLLTKISVLPQHSPRPFTEHLGYHSLFEVPSAHAPPTPYYFNFTLPGRSKLGSIALAPAFNQQESRGAAYAFPKRFKIEVKHPGEDEFKVVVDWMDEDFPDPGPYPVFFSEIDQAAHKVRITIMPRLQASGAAYFALGEIYLFRQKKRGRIGANMGVWTGRTIEVSESFTMPPLWASEYVCDGLGGFGFPLSDETFASEDLLIAPPEDGQQLSDEVTLELDLGQVREIGRVDLWPAEAPFLMALPSFGFPHKIAVEISLDRNFRETMEIETEASTDSLIPGSPLSFFGRDQQARYLRITMAELGEYKGKRILGLGEISVTAFDNVSSLNCGVTARGIPEAYLDQLPRLVDGSSRHRRILSQGEWIKGLAQRRPLDRRLAVVDRELELARDAWRRTKQRLVVWAGALIGLALIGGGMLQRLHRHRALQTLRRRIARDLHDEVGSSLGSISLSAEELEREAPNDWGKEELTDLSLMAREACASLLEVVWVIDQDAIRLPDLAQKLVERAERVLRGAELTVETSPDYPDLEVPLAVKRHLVMFFKEAIHNCARHAQATRVGVAVTTNDKFLQVAVNDNGCGFDPSIAPNGWGLKNMHKRARELGGEAEIKSQPGEGTTIMLKVPLAALKKNPPSAYQTSN